MRRNLVAIALGGILIAGTAAAVVTVPRTADESASRFTVAVGAVGDAFEYETRYLAADGTELPFGTRVELEVLSTAKSPDHWTFQRDALLLEGTIEYAIGINGEWERELLPIREWLDLSERMALREEATWDFAWSSSTYDSFDEWTSRVPGVAFQGKTLEVGTTLRLLTPLLRTWEGSSTSGGAASFLGFSAHSPISWTVDFRTYSYREYGLQDWRVDRLDHLDGAAAVVLVNEQPVADVGGANIPLSDASTHPTAVTEMWFTEGGPYPKLIEQRLTDPTPDAGSEGSEAARTELVSFKAGSMPIPWSASREDDLQLIVPHPYVSVLPADGEGSTLLYPLGDAYRDVVEGVGAPGLLLFLRLRNAELVSAMALPGPHDADDRDALAWYLTWKDPWSGDGYGVMAERIDGIAAPLIEELGEVGLNPPHVWLEREPVADIADAERAYRTLFLDAPARVDFVQWGLEVPWRTSMTCIFGISHFGDPDVDSSVQMRRLTVGNTDVGRCMGGAGATLQAVMIDYGRGTLVGAATVESAMG